MLGANHEPVAGLGLQDCVALKADVVDHLVSWRSGKSIGLLSGQPIRLRIELKDAQLYSFRLGR